MLIALAAVGFLAVNGAFVYGAFYQADALDAAMRNPIAAAFIIEALLLVWVFAYLLRKWEVSRLHPAWFVLLSLIGSIAFALPVALLWRTKEGVTPPRE
jgi:hypothetical protein